MPSRYNAGLSTRSTSSRHSEDSQYSQSTAPTSLHSRPSIYQAHTDPPAYSDPYDFCATPTSDPRSSAGTYLSGVSEEAFYEEPESYDPEYEIPQYRAETQTESRPSTPADFANFFPSSKRLYIRHDDATQDGNMNLQVDVDDSSSGRKSSVQLFYLRMHDLKKREFSLRRYERASGREVCHSSRKYVKSGSEKKSHNFTSSMSQAFASMRGNKPEFKRTNSGLSIRSGHSAQRQDSGYGSDLDDDEESLESFMAEKKQSLEEKPTNIIKLEFSNYAQVEIKRGGNKSSKRHSFEYWGHSYSWKRITEKDGPGKAVSYHLFKGDSDSAVAHIVPEMRSPAQVHAEEIAGGWVPPCSMWISDPTVLEALTDVADVVVATGLIALVDDSIKLHFNPKPKSIQVGLPLTQLKLDMDFIGPKAMVEHMFKRRNSGGSTKDREPRPSPLRHESAMAAY